MEWKGLITAYECQVVGADIETLPLPVFSSPRTKTSTGGKYLAPWLALLRRTTATASQFIR